MTQSKKDASMKDRMTWPEICRSGQFKGVWVALDKCRYDSSSMQPIEGEVVDSDEDIAALCGRLREAERGSCAILFCEGDVLVHRTPGAAPISERHPRQNP
jgi:hypothetical protein